MEAAISAYKANGFELIGVEIPWSHYGQRGVLDAAFRSKSLINGQRVLVLAEFKSKLADIGRAVRQVHLTQAYFFSGISNKERYVAEHESTRVLYPLIVHADPENLSIALRYSQLLSEVDIQFFHPQPSVAEKISSQYRLNLAFQRIESDRLLHAFQSCHARITPFSQNTCQ